MIVYGFEKKQCFLFSKHSMLLSMSPIATFGLQTVEWGPEFRLTQCNKYLLSSTVCEPLS